MRERDINAKKFHRVEYEVDHARTHVHAALEGCNDKLTHEWIAMRLQQADELLTSAVQLMWHEFGWGTLPVGVWKGKEK
jgi:hypothetical protein